MDDRSERERHLDALYAAVRDSATGAHGHVGSRATGQIGHWGGLLIYLGRSMLGPPRQPRPRTVGHALVGHSELTQVSSLRFGGVVRV